jgi:ABC-type dipeptide/oligopeptide/nickel transport system permease component
MHKILNAIRRLVQSIVTLFGVGVVVVFLLRVVPGDPTAMMIGPGASAQDIIDLRAHYHLDEPLGAQFLGWLRSAVGGDFGTSISLHRDVMEVLLSRLPATLELAFAALFIAIAVGMTLAVIATFHEHRTASGVLNVAVGLLLAVPDFVWALVFVLLFGVLLPFLPLSGRIDPTLDIPFATHFMLVESLVTGRFAVFTDIASHMVMPVLALAIPLSAIIARVLTSSLTEAMEADYVLLARIKGHSRLRLILQEALPNAIGPTLALTGVQFTFLVGGTVVVERIFAYPGIGNLGVDAVINRDFPLIQGLVLAFGAIFIIVNLLIDLAVTALDPRLSHA